MVCITFLLPQEVYEAKRLGSIKSPNGRNVITQAIIEVNCIVSGRNYDILTSIIAQLLTSRPFGDLSRIPGSASLTAAPTSGQMFTFICILARRPW